LFDIAWYGFDKSKQAGNGTSTNSNVSFNSITDSKIEKKFCIKCFNLE